MKTIYYIKTSLLALVTMVSCTEMEIRDESQDSTNNGLLQELSITGKDFQFEDTTRSSVTIGESGASFTWDEDDVIGIFPDKGDQVSFAMAEGAGTQTATFSGGGWALKSSSTYSAYYPHVYENRDLTAIPVSYIGQTQNGNANTDHIGTYDFMAAGVSTPENGAVAFDMQHLGSLVQLTLTIPEPSTISKVVLNSSTEFTETGIINLTSETPSVASMSQSKTFEVALKDITTTEADENVTVYFMTAPVDLTDTEIIVRVHCVDATILEGKVTGVNLLAGKAYRLFADKLTNESDEPEETIPNNEIWYTSINGEVLAPYKDYAFDVNITSNIYKNGKGIITFDGDITKIGDDAFNNCSFTSITIPNKVTTIGKQAFRDCCDLTNIRIGDGVTVIDEYAFYNCRNLISLVIPDGVISIEKYAFINCVNLSSITLGDSVSKLGTNVFEYCYNIKEFKGKFASEDNLCLIANGELNAFAHGSGVSEYTIPDSVTAIGTSVFYNNTNLKSIFIPDSVITIGGGAFSGCINLISVIIGNSVTSISDGAFRNCKSLNSIFIPNSVTAINREAFYGCSNLVSANIGYNVTYIGDNAFKGCQSLTSITIPDKVIRVGNSAFKECINITEVVIGYNVSWIHDMAFEYCRNLKDVYCKSENPTTIYSNTFSNCSKDLKIYVPAGSLSNYKAANHWKDLNIVEMNNSVVGTSWVWSEAPITWTFTFDENEVTFDYRAEFSPTDISTDQYKAPYTYAEGVISFDMTIWSGIVLKYSGEIIGNKMTLKDNGVEKMDIVLTKVQ